MQEPPTPMISFRMGGRFDLDKMDDQSMLMDQQPIFGDESVMDMTFELGSDAGLDGALNTADSMDIPNLDTLSRGMKRGTEHRWHEVEDAALDGIWTPTKLGENSSIGRTSTGSKASGNIGDGLRDGDEDEDEDGDSTIEVPRNASFRTETLDHRSMTFEGDATVIYDPMLDFDTPPSPFNISREIEIAHLDNDGYLSERSLEETTFTARGERPTWNEEERSRAGSSTGPGTGMDFSTSGSSKRPASSPRQAKEKKKSKVRSPSGDDYYTRRLSRSSSSASTIPSPFIAAAVLSSSSIRRSSSRHNSFNLDPVTYSSRPSEGDHSVFIDPPQGLKQNIGKEKREKSITSPALRAPSPSQLDIAPTPPPVPRPTLLSRFLAKSSVLHPPTPVQGSSSGSTSKTVHSPIPELATFQEPVRTAATPDLGSSSGSSRRSIESPEIARGQTSQRSEDHSIRFDDSVSSMNEVRRYNSSDSHASIRRLVDQESSVEYDIPTTPAAQLELNKSRSNHSEGTDASLRRSTSQRVLGFFSDLLRSSTSSSKREKSEVEASTSSSQRGNPALQESTSSSDRSKPNEVSDDLNRSGNGESSAVKGSRGEYSAGLEGQPSRHNQSTSTDDPSRLARLYPTTSSIPALKYIPLTRPTKAFVSNTASRVANPTRQPKPTSSIQVRSNAKPAATSKFASAALARLPPPGKGSSSSGEKITVKSMERASNLQARRALFDRPTNLPSTGTGMKKTIPLTDKIPGKAMQARAEQRSQFDKGVQQRLEEKKRMKEKEEREKKEREEREYRERRKETVVKARPVPEMYKRKI